MILSLDSESFYHQQGADSEESVNWVALVTAVRENRPEALAELYTRFAKGVRFHICRQLGPQDLDDRVHDVFLIVVQCIQRGELREPDRLMGFVRTVVRRQVAARIHQAAHERADPLDPERGTASQDEDPEARIIEAERSALVRSVLDELSERDREILRRFYLLEQPQEQICAEMGLSVTQFRLLKSRAKLRFGEIGKKRLAHRFFSAFFLRTFGAGLH